jgi:periplasmic protein TonB
MLNSLNLSPSTPKPEPKPAGRVPKLLSSEERWGGTFYSRLKEFLTERPVRLPSGRGRLPFTPEANREGFLDNLKVAMSAEPRSARGADSSPLLIRRQSGWNLFVQNLRDFVSPPKLPPLKVTSAPAPPPKDIWTKDENASRAQWISVLVHALIVLLLGVPLVHELATTTTRAETKEVTSVDLSGLSDYIPKLPKGSDRSQGGGGGGERNPIPASKGKLPKFSMTQLAPPTVVIQNPNPKLPVEPTVVVPPDIRVPQPNLPNMGDPLAAMVTQSSGPGFGGGIGTGGAGGVGSGSGPGVGPGDGGGIGGGHFHPGHDGIGDPVCIYCPNPPFTEEARKARVQGTVILQVEILSDGRTGEVRVLRGLGLGLDESALRTVRTWRWKPVIGPGGKPVAVEFPMEVNFRLL